MQWGCPPIRRRRSGPLNPVPAGAPGGTRTHAHGSGGAVSLDGGLKPLGVEGRDTWQRLRR